METLGLLFKVFWAPGEAMFLISKKPRVVAPLVLLTLVSLGSSIFTFSRIDSGTMIIRQMERRGPVSEEQRARIQESSRIMTPVFVASATLGTAVFITIAAAIYFGVFTLIGRESGFKAFYAVTAFAYLPLVFRNLVAAVQVWLTPPSSIVMEELGGLSLAVFLDPTSVSRVVYGLASIIDIVSIWIAILLIIGFKFLIRKNVTLAARVTGVVAVYFLFSAVGVLLRLLSPS